MKMTEKDKPVHTIPDGVWESPRTDRRGQKKPAEHQNELTTDEQGNGYPTAASDQKAKG